MEQYIPTKRTMDVLALYKDKRAERERQDRVLDTVLAPSEATYGKITPVGGINV
jgi:hypothetical protein